MNDGCLGGVQTYLSIHYCPLARRMAPAQLESPESHNANLIRVRRHLLVGPFETILAEVCPIPVNGDAQPRLKLNRRQVLEVRFGS